MGKSLRERLERLEQTKIKPVSRPVPLSKLKTILHAWASEYDITPQPKAETGEGTPMSPGGVPGVAKGE